jgi:hypothetical protein
MSAGPLVGTPGDPHIAGGALMLAFPALPSGGPQLGAPSPGSVCDVLELVAEQAVRKKADVRRPR